MEVLSFFLQAIFGVFSLPCCSSLCSTSFVYVFFEPSIVFATGIDELLREDVDSKVRASGVLEEVKPVTA